MGIIEALLMLENYIYIHKSKNDNKDIYNEDYLLLLKKLMFIIISVHFLFINR